MKKIKLTDMSTVHLSIDELGQIYFYKNRILRVINDDFIEQVQNIFDCGLIEEITTKNFFPKTWISDIEIEGYSLVIEHERIVNWNYPYEWSFDMLRDAGLLILQVNNIANKYGYQIMDGHSSNVVFNMNQPQYIDFGSFIKFDKNSNTSWASYHIFHNHFYIPLYLWSKGYSNIARNILLMNDFFNEEEFYKVKYPILNMISYNNFSKIAVKLKTLALVSNNKILTRINSPYKQKIALVLNSFLKKYFTNKKLKNNIKDFNKQTEYSMWSDYHDKIDPKTNKRFIRLVEIINSLKDASSLVELASNQGKFAELVLENTHLNKVIATDYDNEAVNIMYINNRGKGNFLPLLFDMIRTNGRNYDEYLSNRIKCDIVIALAVTHHLILSQKISIDYIFKTLLDLTNKYVIVEFMPIGLYSGDMNNIPDLPSFYNLEWFKSSFLKYFDLILDEELELNRHVFVGKRKENY